MRTGCVVTDTNWSVVKRGVESLVRVGWVVDTAEAAAQYLDTPGTELLVIEALPELLTTELVQTADSEGIQVAALVTTADGEDLAKARGVGHCVRQPDDLRRLIHGRATVTPSRSGQVWAVWGPHGSPGRTTVTLGLAAGLAARGRRVMVIDADGHGGTIAQALGLVDRTPGFLAAARRSQKGELQRDHLTDLAVTYRGKYVSFDVLTGVSRRFRSPEAPRDAVDEILQHLRGLVDVTVVDTGSDLPGSTPGAGGAEETTAHFLEVSDRIVALCRADPSGVARFARAYPDAERAAAGSPISVWLNGVDPSRRAAGEDATLREVLWRFAGVSDATALPWDPQTCRRAALDAVTIRDVAPHSGLVAALHREVSASLPDPSTRKAPQRPAHTDPSPGGPLVLLRQKWHQLTALR